MATKESPRRTQSDRRKRVRKRPWMKIEYLLCGFALLMLLGMTVNTAFDLAETAFLSERALEEQSDEDDNYVTYIYNAFRKHRSSRTEQIETEPEKELDLSLVDVTQFAEDNSYAGALYAMRGDYPQAEEILRRYTDAAVTVDGEDTTVGAVFKNAIPTRLLQMAVDYPQTMDFVLNYPEKVGQTFQIDLSDKVKPGEVPALIQWDERWGYTTYGDGLLGYTGCGPTCASMVLIALTGDATLTPDVVARYSDECGYYEKNSGSRWQLMGEGMTHYGVGVSNVDVEENALQTALAAGSPIICSVTKGSFTRGGHFVVLTGYQKGAFTLNDPNSVDNSQRTWTFQELQPQIRKAWAYTAPKTEEQKP